MIGLLRLLGSVILGFAGGYIGNDVVDVVQENQQLKQQAAASGTAADTSFDPQRIFARWMNRQFLIKFGIVAGVGTVIAILLLSPSKRKKLFK